MILSRTGAVCGLVALLALVAGCSSGGSDGYVGVRGKLVDGGKPFVLDTAKIKLPPGALGVPPGTRPIAVVFVSESGEQFPGDVSNDGTFLVPGPERKGLKPGKYKIAVTASFGGGGADYFGDKFSIEKTQISRDLKTDEEIVIDVSKPQG
jgi:hypothetical protein